MATKNDGSIVGWVICIGAAALLYKHFSSPAPAATGNSAAGIQSEADAAAMTADTSTSRYDGTDADPIKVPPTGPDGVRNSPWWIGPPWTVDPKQLPPRHPLPPIFETGPFMEDTEPGAGPYGEPGVRQVWPSDF